MDATPSGDGPGSRTLPAQAGIDAFDVAARVAVITGAARGIGRSLAIGMAAAGMRVVIGDLDSRLLDDAASQISAQGGQVVAVPGDVTEVRVATALMKAARKTFGSLVVLVNNAGV
jgi:NAD(P)-dependent dehydrogenase (short-subunit alcohol dehydrogenase family)